MAKKKRSVKVKGRVKRRPRAKTKKKSTRKRVGARRKPAKRKAVARKRKPAKRKATRKRKPAAGRQLIKQVERSSVERVMAGKRKRRRKRASTKKRKIVMAGSRRRRKVGALGGNGMLIGLGIGALAIYLLTKKSTPTQGNYQLPPLTTTNNQTRNTQSQDIINYAIAGGLALDAIIKLIGLLNSSSDNDVDNIYDNVNTTGDLSVYV
jgi:hypothetical protein